MPKWTDEIYPLGGVCCCCYSGRDGKGTILANYR